MVAILRSVLGLRRPVKVLNILWTRKNTFLGGLFVLLKLIRVNIDWFSSPTFTRAVVTYDPLSLYDHNTHTFKILNRSNMTFLIEPDPDQVCPLTKSSCSSPCPGWPTGSKDKLSGRRWRRSISPSVSSFSSQKPVTRNCSTR